MQGLGKLLVVAGLLVAGIGAVMLLGVPIGRLPGDFVIRRGQSTIYLPLTTSVLLSLVATLVAALWRR